MKVHPLSQLEDNLQHRSQAELHPMQTGASMALLRLVLHHQLGRVPQARARCRRPRGPHRRVAHRLRLVQQHRLQQVVMVGRQACSRVHQAARQTAGAGSPRLVVRRQGLALVWPGMLHLSLRIALRCSKMRHLLAMQVLPLRRMACLLPRRRCRLAAMRVREQYLVATRQAKLTVVQERENKSLFMNVFKVCRDMFLTMLRNQRLFTLI